ncbi:MAG: hypothetical protein AAFR90_15570 [Pseudomonadota bacterium]
MALGLLSGAVSLLLKPELPIFHKVRISVHWQGLPKLDGIWRANRALKTSALASTSIVCSAAIRLPRRHPFMAQSSIGRTPPRTHHVNGIADPFAPYSLEEQVLAGDLRGVL